MSTRTINGELATLCSKWTRPRSKSPQERAKNMSPADVLSGVHLGMDRQDVYGSNNHQEDFSVERRKQLASLESDISS